MKVYKVVLLLLIIIFAVIGYRIATKKDDSSKSTGEAPNISRAQGYSGSSSCKECHQRFYDLWSDSHHGLAMQPYTQEFSRRNLTSQTRAIKIGKEGASYLAEIGIEEDRVKETVSGKVKSYPIAYVMGGKNVYYFLTTLARGRLQTLPIAYDVNKKQWYDTVASGVRHFPGTQEDEPVHWTDPMYTFNTSCYNCHVSQLSTHYDLETDTYHTRWSEPGINCEACHGPGLEHVEVCRSAAEDNPPGDMKIINTKVFSAEQTNSMCSSCHAKLSPITASFTPGDRYFDHYDLVTLESPDFYPDGRDLGENYTMTLWRLSPCVKSGELDCLHCHTSSGRYRFKEPAGANDACLPCHQKQVANNAAHSRHKQLENAPQCISCHMPMTEFANMNRSDHSMRPPVPAATLKYKSPNACNLCHTDTKADWAQKQVSEWGKDTRQKEYLRLADFVDQARREDWQNLDQILAYIQAEERDEIITSSLVRLLRACNSNKKWPTLINILENDPSPLVRAAAAQALKGYLTNEGLAALLKGAKDDYRLVRVRAAASMAAITPQQLPGIADRSNDLRQDFERAMNELVEAVTARLDHHASHYNLGNIYMEQGKIDQALASYQTSIKLRPDFIPSYVNIAFAYNAKGQNEKAEHSFREALKREPGNVLILTNLALLLAERGRLREAESVFRRVLGIDPNSATAAFNLAVILADQQPQESLSFSKKAFLLCPDDSQYAYTYAFYLHKSEKTEEAIAVLQGMVNRQTSFADAYILLGQIFEQKGKLKEAVSIYMKAAGNMKLSELLRRQFSSRAEQTRR